jgi:single-strand DNA-binding protein
MTMARNKNHVSLIGITGKDAEVRQTQGGVSYARFSLATSSGGYTRQDGTQVPEVTQWHNITAWDRLAQMCGQYVKKGMKLDVEGKIVYTQYKDQQGIDRMGVDIVADDIILMSKPREEAQQQTVQQAQMMQPQQPTQYQAGPQYQQPPMQGQGFQPQQGGGINNPDNLPFY